jgi:hypothetical protein
MNRVQWTQIAINVLSVLISIFGLLAQFPDFADSAKYLVLVVGVLNILLNAIQHPRASARLAVFHSKKRP